MAIITRTQSTSASNQGHNPALVAGESEAAQPRFAGHPSTRRHTTHTKITWPEKYHERYRLPSGIEHQPF